MPRACSLVGEIRRTKMPEITLQNSGYWTSLRRGGVLESYPAKVGILPGLLWMQGVEQHCQATLSFVT